MNTQTHTGGVDVRDAEAVQLGQRIQDARSTTKRAVVANSVGVHENTFGKWERGETVPDVLQLLRIAAVLGKPVEYFLAPLVGSMAAEEPATYQVPVRHATRAVWRGEYVYVPLMDVRAGAGAAALQDVSLVKQMHCFLADYLNEELGIAHEQLVLVQMAGAVTEPSIQTGDLVLVDLADRGVVSEGAHLVRVDQALAIKVLHRKPGRIVVSNGRADPTAFEVDLDALVGGEFEVLGRCRWVGERLT